MSEILIKKRATTRDCPLCCSRGGDCGNRIRTRVAAGDEREPGAGAPVHGAQAHTHAQPHLQGKDDLTKNKL